jgi:hypothetical protein
MKTVEIDSMSPEALQRRLETLKNDA